MTDEDKQLLDKLSPDQAAEMYNFVMGQARSDQKFHARHTNLDLNALEQRTAPIIAGGFTTGGGIMKRLPPVTT